MQKVFSKPAELEKLSKEVFSIPPFLMMENAARSMADFILSQSPSLVLILCGKGNNGGDGYALARMLYNKTKVNVIALEEPNTQEASVQYEICKKLEIEISSGLPSKLNADIIVDCIYGIGFHGDLKPEVQNLLNIINSTKALKIACDIPSGLYFKADYTFTMGEQKTALYSDNAKEVCGKIIVSDLGLPRESFESNMNPDAYLIEESDCKLPLRTKKSSHKGTYGHTAVFAGEKSGAGIIAATAAMNFGSGLTTLVKQTNSNLDQFKISPELMISDSIPAKTTCVVVGPGLGTKESELEIIAGTIIDWVKNTPKPAIVFDADMMTWKGLPNLLKELNHIENIKIVLTPHLSELSRFVKDYDVKTLADSPKEKIQLGIKLNQLYSKTAVVMKSSNTFIACQNKVYICADGAQSLAKGGSGDVLAGMIGALLSQGYNLLDTVITAAETHALASVKIGKEAFYLTPERLIQNFL